MFGEPELTDRCVDSLFTPSQYEYIRWKVQYSLLALYFSKARSIAAFLAASGVAASAASSLAQSISQLASLGTGSGSSSSSSTSPSSSSSSSGSKSPSPWSGTGERVLFRSTLCLGILVNRLEFSPNVLGLTPCPPCPPCRVRLARHHRGDP